MHPPSLTTEMHLHPEPHVVFSNDATLTAQEQLSTKWITEMFLLLYT